MGAELAYVNADRLISLEVRCNRGQKSNMVLALQVVSSHLPDVVFCARAFFANRHLPQAANEREAPNRVNFARPVSPRWLLHHFFVGTFDEPPARANSPRSRFPAPLAPDRRCEDEMLQLFHSGINGMLVLDPS
jgi:hypothetical protein